MKRLYEIVTDRVGESYVRSYCWAECEEDAREMFAAIFPSDKRGAPYSVASVRQLFMADDPEFVTPPDDCGWSEEDSVRIEDLSKMYSVKLSKFLNDN